MSAGRVAVVTGATGGMGRLVATRLAEQGMRVVALARDPRRADDLRVQIARSSGPAGLEVITGDLSTRDGLRAAAESIAASHPAVHVLVNNAGAHYPQHLLTPDGIERHVAVDYVAAYGFTVHLDEQLRRGRARIVNIASDTIRDTRQLKLFGAPRPATIDPDELTDLTRLNRADGFVPFEAYARAKLLAVTAGYALADGFVDDGVTLNAVHPGIVATDLVDDLVPRALRPFRGFIRRTLLTPEQGAAAAVRLATSAALDGVTGRYFVRDVDTVTPTVSYDHDVQRTLCASTNRFLGLGRRGHQSTSRIG